ncbi:hypothetical protein NIES4071_65440 [Calothrix sp. NIES-4071]|nr:hypothetical protein NIES4071_65440 [Calothrix sp. NIES-4071]BAZ60848.1 hypothetical protein NIES4105_65400 [Calothrix sp. NIES-4105]
MSKPNFATMTRSEFRQYILEHREDDEAVSIYLEKFRPLNPKVYPAPKSLADLDNFPELHRQHLEQQDS